MLAAAALLAAVVPLLLGAVGRESPAESRRQIAALSQAERDELQRKYREWKSLSDEQRDELRKLHTDLQQHPDLVPTLDRYAKWLSHLPPWDRLALRQQTDPFQRMALVRKIEQQRIAEQEQRQRERESRDRREWGPLNLFALRRYPAMGAEPLAQVMQIIEGTLNLTPEQRQNLEPAEGPKRRLLVLIAALQQAAAAPGGRWPSLELLEQLKAPLTDDRVTGYLDSLTPEAQQAAIVPILVRSITSQWMDIWSRELSQREVRAVYESLGRRQRDELNQLSDHDRQRRIRFYWIGLQAKDVQPQLEELTKLYQPMYPQQVLPRRPMGPPGFPDGNRSGRGERPPRDRSSDSDDNPDRRPPR